MIKDIISQASSVMDSTENASFNDITPVEWWRSSSLGSCMRGRVIARLVSGKALPGYDDTTLGIFKMGHITEEAVMTILRHSPEYVMFTQGEMYDPNLNIKGHFDALLINIKTGHTLLLENKSRNSNAFKFATKEASLHYKMQAHSYLSMINDYGFTIEYDNTVNDQVINQLSLTYTFGDLKVAMQNAQLIAKSQQDAMAYALNNNIGLFVKDSTYRIRPKVTKAEILYVSKDNFETLEFEVNLNDKQLEKAWKFEIETLNECWSNKKAPPATDPKDWQSKYCRFCKAGICQQLDDPAVVRNMYDIYEKNTGIKVM